jgi:hypothetical protein
MSFRSSYALFSFDSSQHDKWHWRRANSSHAVKICSCKVSELMKYHRKDLALSIWGPEVLEGYPWYSSGREIKCTMIILVYFNAMEEITVGHVDWIWRPGGGVWPWASRNFRLYQTWLSHLAVTQLMEERQQQSCGYRCVWMKLSEIVKFVFKDWALSISNPKTLKGYLCFSSQRKIKSTTTILVSFGMTEMEQ